MKDPVVVMIGEMRFEAGLVQEVEMDETMSPYCAAMPRGQVVHYRDVIALVGGEQGKMGAHIARAADHKNLGLVHRKILPCTRLAHLYARDAEDSAARADLHAHAVCVE